MFNALVPYVVALRERWPRLYAWLVSVGRRRLRGRLGIYPRPLANELGAVADVLQSSQWNMAYGKGLVHERLERAFADYVGVGHAIAVNTGGMALQMSIRALGLKPGDEIIHQVDTCAASALAVVNAGCTPLFADISSDTFMLSMPDARAAIGPATKAIIATHMWGNVEDLDAVADLKRQYGLHVIEDACLALGATYRGRRVGALSDIGVFSFGCLKPIQTGEGGMIVTNDEALAKELRAMRHWGDRTIEFGVRDVVQLSWNGRMSEILAAVALEQLKGFPAHLARLCEAVAEFAECIATIEGVELVCGTADRNSASFTQAVLRVDEGRLGWKKPALMEELRRRGIHVWHANFELISSLTFFKDGHWREWLLRADVERTERSMHRQFPTAQRVFDATGLGLGQMNFLSKGNLTHLRRQFEQLASRPMT